MMSSSSETSVMKQRSPRRRKETSGVGTEGSFFDKMQRSGTKQDGKMKQSMQSAVEVFRKKKRYSEKKHS